MPQAFKLKQRVALVDGDPLRIGRVMKYAVHPTRYTVTFEDGSKGEYRAGALRAVTEEPIPESNPPITIGERVHVQTWNPVRPAYGRWIKEFVAGTLVAVNHGEAVVLRDQPVTREMGGKVRTFHHIQVPVARLSREPPKPIGVGDRITWESVGSRTPRNGDTRGLVVYVDEVTDELVVRLDTARHYGGVVFHTATVQRDRAVRE